MAHTPPCAASIFSKSPGRRSKRRRSRAARLVSGFCIPVSYYILVPSKLFHFSFTFHLTRPVSRDYLHGRGTETTTASQPAPSAAPRSGRERPQGINREKPP